MRTVKILGFVVMLLAFATTAEWTYGQVPQGQILGTVSDPTGSPVPEAAVTLKNELTGIARTQSTTNSGDYTFPYLDSGTYSVTVEKAGFNTTVLRGIKLQVAEKKRADAQVRLGEVKTTVEVTGAGSKLDTDTATVGSIVSQRELINLPIYGRDFSRLAFLMPGVRLEGGRDSYTGGNFGTKWGTSINIGGSGWEKNAYNLDGVDNSMAGDGGPAVNPSIDAIQEFRIDRSTFSAEYGLGGGMVQTVTKAGSNAFHGALWEYLRNNKLNAGNYITHKQDTVKRNEFGLNVGGPIVKDKAFFFFNWESLRERSNQQLVTNVFTQKARNGDLSEYPETPTDPLTGNPFLNKVISTDRLNSVSLAYINSFMPLPNLPGTVNGTLLNYVVNRISNDSFNQFIGRADYNPSEKDRLFLRLTEQPRNGIRAGSNAFNVQSEDMQFHNGGLGWIRNWGPSVITEARLGFHQERSIFKAETVHNPQPRIQGFGYGTTRPVVTNGDYMNTNYIAFGDFGWPIAFDRKDRSVSANATFLLANHVLKVGFQGAWKQYNFDQYPQFVTLGYFGPIYTGSGPADYLLGLPYQAQDRLGFLNNNLRNRTFSVFVQDDWRITPNLTLNLGLRYDLGFAPYDAKDRWGTFDTNIGKIVVAGDHIVEGVNPFFLNAWGPLITTADKTNLPRRSLTFGDHNNFAPRVGFAWRPFKNTKTVVRGGYGIIYLLNNQTNINTANFSAPYSQRMLVVNAKPTPSFTITAPFLSPTTPTPLTFGLDPHMRTPYMQQVTLGIQQELPWGMAGEIMFQDQNSKKLETGWDANSAVLGAGSINSRRPFYPTFGPGINIYHNEGTQRYDALELSVKKTSTHYSFWWSHTWSKKIGWGLGAFETSNIVYPYDRDAFSGPARYVPHLDKLSFLLDLPAGKGRRWLNRGGVVDAVLGGWTVGGIFNLHIAGAPLTIGWSGDSANVGITGVRPNRICSGRLSNPTMAKWFDTSCFVAPTTGTFGNSGTGIIFGPSSFGGDFSIHKNFSIREKATLQFRSEFFNVFNHPNWGSPRTGANSSAFGQILTKDLEPRVIQFALRLTF